MFLGIDLSRRDIATVLSDESGSAILALRAARPTEGGTPAAWLAAMHTARETVLRAGAEAAQIRCVALAMDAPLNARGVVGKGADTEGWEGFDVPHALREHLGILVTRAENRVLCEALGEARFGALRTTESVQAGVPQSGFEYSNANASNTNASNGDWLFVHIGHRLGAAACVNGQILRGASGAALDIGSLCIERDGALSSSGRRGSLEAYCSGESLMTRAASYGITLRSSREIWEMAADNFAARSLCDDYARRLAQGLGSVLCILNTPRVVLGGSLALELGETLLAPLRQNLREFCAPQHSENLQLLSSQLKADSAVLGAVAVAMQNEYQTK